MNSRNRLSSENPLRAAFGGTRRTLILAFLACVTASPLSAYGSEETGIITLLPTRVTQQKSDPAISCPDLTVSADSQGKPACGVLLEFDLRSVPIAKVTSARLILVARRDSPRLSQTISANRVDPTGKPFGASAQSSSFGDNTLMPSLPRQDSPAVWWANRTFWERFPVMRGPIWLGLTTTKGEGRLWHSERTETSAFRPRLVLEYAHLHQPAMTQSDGLPAVRSPLMFQPRLDGIREFPKAWSFSPVFYYNWLFIVTDNNGQKALLELNPLGKTLRQVAVPPPGSRQNLGQHLLMTKDGRLYIVGDGRILVYAIDAESNPPMPVLLSDIQVNGLNPEISPALGNDGSLYFVNGREVFGLNPDLKELWKVTLEDGKNSRITVGPSGRFVYLTNRTEGLVAINTQTGSSFKVKLPDQEKLRATDSPALHAPVVIRHPDGSEKIYVAANAVNDGVLACFDNLKTVDGRSDSGTITAAAGWIPLKGLWGQPLPDQLPPGSTSDPKEANRAKRICAVRIVNGRGGVEMIDWLDGSIKTSDKAPRFAVADSPYLINGGNPLMDRGGNCFVWNGDGETGLYASGPGFSGRLNGMESAVPADARLFFGYDGTLYAIGSKDRILRAIVPKQAPGAY